LKNLEEPISEDEMGDEDRVVVPGLVVEVGVSKAVIREGVTGILLGVEGDECFLVKTGRTVEMSSGLCCPTITPPPSLRFISLAYKDKSLGIAGTGGGGRGLVSGEPLLSYL
jgi:hypothetical protein